MAEPPNDTDIDVLAALAGLSIAAEHRPGVRQNLAMIAGMAASLRDFPLDDCADEPAPVFQLR